MKNTYLMKIFDNILWSTPNTEEYMLVGATYKNNNFISKHIFNISNTWDQERKQHQILHVNNM
jgi:hypothetical protein